MEKALTKKLIYKVASPIIGTALVASITAGVVFAWPTKGPDIDCNSLHWEMQNDTNTNQLFTGKITSPIEFTTTSEVKPSEWGVLDKSFSNLSGNVTFTASVSMGGDTRNTTKTIECAQPTPTPSPNPTPTPSPSQAPCINTDIKGTLEYTGNHISGNPVIAHFENIAQNQDCSNQIFIHAFGSKQEPESLGWLESQKHVFSKTINVPKDARDFRVEIGVPNADFCWYQVEATRNPNVLIPPEYHGTDMIEYVFVKDTDSCPPPSPAPSASPCVNCGSPEINITNNNNNTNNNVNNNNVNVTSTQTVSVPTELPATGPGTVAVATLAGVGPLGFALSKFRKGRLYKEEQSLEEFASSIFKDRTSNLG